MVVGVHTPEFSFEHDLDLVRQAIAARAIDYPVAVDNDYAVWRAFDNHYWPALYFVDADGIIRDHHFGEGRYEQSERPSSGCSASSATSSRRGAGVEAEADWQHLRTPETYLGYGRSEHFASPKGAPTTEPRVRAPAVPAPQPLGARRRVDDRQERVVLDEAGGCIAYRFHARTRISCCPPGRGIRFRSACSSTAAPPGPSHGVDVDEDGNGVLRDGRLYQLVREHDRSERTLEITFLKPGVEAYAFTFG